MIHKQLTQYEKNHSLNEGFMNSQNYIVSSYHKNRLVSELYMSSFSSLQKLIHDISITIFFFINAILFFPLLFILLIPDAFLGKNYIEKMADFSKGFHERILQVILYETPKRALLLKHPSRGLLIKDYIIIKKY